MQRQPITVRFDPETIVALKRLAWDRHETLTALLERAAKQMLAEPEKLPPVVPPDYLAELDRVAQAAAEGIMRRHQARHPETGFIESFGIRKAI